MGLSVKFGLALLFVCVLAALPSSEAENSHYLLGGKVLVFTEGQIFGNCRHFCETGALKRTDNYAVFIAKYRRGCRALSNCRLHRRGNIDEHGYANFDPQPNCDYCECDCN